MAGGFFPPLPWWSIGSSVLMVLETVPDLTMQTSVLLRQTPVLKKLAFVEILRARLAATTASCGSRLSTRKVWTALSVRPLRQKIVQIDGL